MRNKRFILIGCLLFVICQVAMAQFEVLTLDSCMRSAQQRNCTIRSAQLEVAISREVKKQMLWKYFPQVSLTGFAFGAAKPLIDADVTEIGLEGSASDFLKQAFEILDGIVKLQDSAAYLSTEIKWLRWGVSAQAQAVQPLFWGGQIVTANKLAKLGIDAAQLKEEVSERDVLQEVTDTYWMLAGLMEKRETVTKVTELLDSISDVANTAYNHGLVTRNDLLRVQLKQNEMQTKSIQLENGIDLVGRLLCIMIGVPYEHEPVLETFSEEETVPTLALQPELHIDGRPETKLLDLNLRYNQLMRRLTLGESLPHLAIGISGGYSNYFEEHKVNGVAFATLSIPLTGWGETSHKLKQHDYQIQQAQLMQSHLREKLELQNRQSYDQLVESVKLMEQHKSSRDLAEENYRVALMNYEAGVGTMTELLESQALLLQASNAYTDSRISYRTAARKFQEYNK